MPQSSASTILLSDVAASIAGFFIFGSGLPSKVSAAGDLNNDGIADVVIGTQDVGRSRGSSYVVFGRDDGFNAPVDLQDISAGQGGFVVRGARDYDYPDFPVGVGDVNGDGIDDLAIGAEGSFFDGRGSGSLFVIYGQTGSFEAAIDLADIEFGRRDGAFAEGLMTHSFSFLSLAAVGDVNGDGLDDFLIGDPPDSVSPGSAGSAYLIYGRVGGLDLPVDITTIGAAGRGVVFTGEPGEDEGTAVSIDRLGDINRDGYDDFTIRSYGRSFFVFGAASLPGALRLQDLTADQGFISERFFLRPLGDVNGDGVPDLAFGVRTVILGRDDGLPAFVPDTIFREAPGQVRTRLSEAGDFNGDGYDDLLVRGFSTESSYSEVNVEFATVVFGRPDGFPAEVNLATVANGIDGVRIDNDIGISLRGFSPAGDVNGDGYEDLLFGAPNIDVVAGVPARTAGAIVVFGRPSNTLPRRGTEGDDTLTGGAGHDALASLAGDDLLQGGAGRDTLRGGLGRDTLDGGAGDDQLRSGGGEDVWTGGAGRDGFLLLANAVGSGNRITITDFARAEGDSVNFARIDADATAAGDQDFTWIGRARFSGTAGELRWDRPAGAAGRDSRLLGDTDGDGTADVTVLLQGVDGVRESWFVL